MHAHYGTIASELPARIAVAVLLCGMLTLVQCRPFLGWPGAIVILAGYEAVAFWFSREAARWYRARGCRGANIASSALFVIATFAIVAQIGAKAWVARAQAEASGTVNGAPLAPAPNTSTKPPTA